MLKFLTTAGGIVACCKHPVARRAYNVAAIRYFGEYAVLDDVLETVLSKSGMMQRITRWALRRKSRRQDQGSGQAGRRDKGLQRRSGTEKRFSSQTSIWSRTNSSL
jgi:hypothetical protein